MCRDQNLISETDGRTDGRTDGSTDVRMKIKKPGVGRPHITQIFLQGRYIYITLQLS